MHPKPFRICHTLGYNHNHYNYYYNWANEFMLCLVEGCEKGPFQFAMLISIQITFFDATSFLLLFWFKLLGGQEIRGLKKKILQFF